MNALLCTTLPMYQFAFKLLDVRLPIVFKLIDFKYYVINTHVISFIKLAAHAINVLALLVKPTFVLYSFSFMEQNGVGMCAVLVF